MLKNSKYEQIINFILENVKQYPKEIVKITSDKFGVTRQYINKLIKKLITENVLIKKGKTRNIIYELKKQIYVFNIEITKNLEEHIIWEKYVKPVLPELKKNIEEICYYGFLEMFNNIIDHSESSHAEIKIIFDYFKIEFILVDNGIGIFKKIQNYFNLDDPRYAIFELSKGKLTSDPDNHSGQGIFFTSRAFNDFIILSNKLTFCHKEKTDFLYEGLDNNIEKSGTAVIMGISKDSLNNIKEVFDKYSDEDEDYSFSKTSIVVNLLLYQGMALVSRSQARRLLSGIDKFKEICLDFKNIDYIGQAFADEIFRVFQNRNLDISLKYINTSKIVEKMIKRAISNRKTK